MAFLGGTAALVAALAFYATRPSQDPAGIDYADIQDYVFVPSMAAAEVTVVNSFRDVVVGTIQLPRQPDQVVVSQGAGALVYTSAQAKTVSVYSFASQAVVTDIPLAFSSATIVLSPDGLTAAVADAQAGAIGIIDLQSNTLSASIAGLSQPTGLTFGEDGLLLYFTDSTSREVGIIDVDTGEIVGAMELSISGQPDDPSQVNLAAIGAVTRTPNGRYGLCVEPISRRLSVLNLGDEREIKTLRLGADPSRPYGTADGRFMMVANNGDRTVTIVSTDTFEVVAILDGAADVTAINTGYFETAAFVLSGSEKKAVVLDLMALANVGDIHFGGAPGPGVVTVDGLKMYVALSDTNELAVIDIEARELLTTIKNVGHAPRGATMLQTNNYCH